GLWTGAERVLGEGNEVHLFVDGKRVSWQQAEKAPASWGPPRLDIGGTNPSNPFGGIIDEGRISNSVRYRDEFTPADRFEPGGQTLALYHFDEAEGDVARDSSRNGYHAKITAATWVKEIAPGEYVPYDADRRAAEWTLNAGGRLHILAQGN